MSAADEWAFPVSGQDGGYQFAELPEGVRLYDVRGSFPDHFEQDSPREKIGYAVHHSVTGQGTDLASDLAVVRAIWDWHVNHNGWGGIGYHRIIGSGRRVYVVGSSASVRAHVKDLNDKWIGWCLLGNFSSAPPDEDQRRALIIGTQWETDRRGVPMLVAPHKRLNLGATECPGAWAAVSAWEGTTLQPQAPPAPLPPPVEDGPVLAELDQASSAIARARDLLLE